jgi:tetratricopeptide (TPR) repeat protein
LSLALAEHIVDKQTAVRLRIFLAWIYQYGEETEEVEALLEENLLASKEMGNLKAQSTIIAYIGRLACDRGAYDEATLRFEEALHIAEALGDSDQIACIENEFGKMELRRGQWKEAKGHFEKIGRWYQMKKAKGTTDLGDRYLYMSTFRDLGRVLYQDREYERARALIEKGIVFFGKRGNKTHLVYAKYWLALVERALGDIAGAIRTAEQAEEWARMLNMVKAKDDLSSLLQQLRDQQDAT